MTTTADAGTDRSVTRSAVVPMNDLKRACDVHADELQAAAARVLSSGWYVHGPEHSAFEAEFAAFTVVDHCIGVANGTDALEIALRSLAPAAGSVVVTA